MCGHVRVRVCVYVCKGIKVCSEHFANFKVHKIVYQVHKINLPLDRENLGLHSRYLTENFSRRFSRNCPLSVGAGMREKNLRSASGRNISE